MMLSLNRGQRMILGGALAFLALLLAGSIRLEPQQREKVDSDVRHAMMRMGADLPAAHKAEWERHSGRRDAIVLLRCSTSTVQ